MFAETGMMDCMTAIVVYLDCVLVNSQTQLRCKDFADFVFNRPMSM